MGRRSIWPDKARPTPKVCERQYFGRGGQPLAAVVQTNEFGRSANFNSPQNTVVCFGVSLKPQAQAERFSEKSSKRLENPPEASVQYRIYPK
jgi:hypothetical protein